MRPLNELKKIVKILQAKISPNYFKRFSVVQFQRFHFYRKILNWQTVCDVFKWRPTGSLHRKRHTKSKIKAAKSPFFNDNNTTHLPCGNIQNSYKTYSRHTSHLWTQTNKLGKTQGHVQV